MSNWRYYRDGKIVQITEDEARHTFDRWGVLSDDRGAATFMIEQLWAEIDRLKPIESAARALRFSAYPAHGSGFVTAVTDGNINDLEAALSRS